MSSLIDIVMFMPSYTYRDGRMIEIPDTVVTEDTEIHDRISNTLVIRPGVKVTTFAPVSGTVRVMSGSTLDARGTVSGTVGLDDGARATFHGKASGTINVDRGAIAQLMPGAVALGILHVEGTLINEGTRGTNVHGRGSVEDRDGSIVRPPSRTLPDGTTIYEG